MSFLNRVYWSENDVPKFKDFTDVVESLKFSNELRNQPGVSLVATAISDSNLVGGLGVDSVKNGLLPSGDTYEWKKRRP